MDEQDHSETLDLGSVIDETRGPVGPIDELVLTGPLPGLDTE
jgi:hypothetical protein